MSALDYAIMVEDSPCADADHRIPAAQSRRRRVASARGELVAVALSDLMSDGLSMVYSFYNPQMERRSLGTMMVLDHIRRAQALGLPHVYLGIGCGITENGLQNPLPAAGATDEPCWMRFTSDMDGMTRVLSDTFTSHFNATLSRLLLKAKRADIASRQLADDAVDDVPVAP